jgi:hypothetical protein
MLGDDFRPRYLKNSELTKKIRRHLESYDFREEVAPNKEAARVETLARLSARLKRNWAKLLQD